jgi:hypothetical protein
MRFYLLKEKPSLSSFASLTIGMMEQLNTRIMQYRVNDRICVNEEIKDGEYPFKNQFSSIPLFHFRGKRSSLKQYNISSYI